MFGSTVASSSSINLDKRTRFEPKTVVSYIGNPAKMVSIQVGELLYTNSPPMIPMMCVFPCFGLVTYQPVGVRRALMVWLNLGF